MKLFIVLNFLFVVKFVGCADLNSKPVGNELERKVLEFDLENGQLRKANAELRIENSNLRLELVSSQEKEKLLLEANELTYMKCSGLSNNTEIITESLKTLWENVHTFNSYINEKMAEYATKLGKSVKKTANEESQGLSTSLMVDEKLFQVACDAKKANGTWTVIQRRINGETTFYRPWAQYKAGFGTMKAEFFIGLDNLHLLTTCATQELLIEMEDFQNEKRHAMYDLFEIGGERKYYALKELGEYSGDAGDSLSYHKSQKFSTFDQDNDESSDNCAKDFRGGWWYNSCLESNLNGEHGDGIKWEGFHGYENSLKFVEIKIRPKSE